MCALGLLVNPNAYGGALGVSGGFIPYLQDGEKHSRAK